jgi:polar amino acid transport system permease protein
MTTSGPIARSLWDGYSSSTVAYRIRRHWLASTVGLISLAIAAFAVSTIASSQRIQWHEVAKYLTDGQILHGVLTTLELTFVSMTLGTVLAVLLATMRMSPSVILRCVAGVYIWFFRGTPLLVQLIFWYNIALFLPAITVAGHSESTNKLISPLTAALLGLTLNVAAYEAEIVRAGLLAVDRGQTEAALAVGMTPTQALRKVVIPQSARVIVPPTGNQTIDMLKATSLVSVIGTGDLLTKAQSIYSQNFLVIELLFVVSAWYLFLTSIATLVQGALERHLGKSVRFSAARVEQ